jgi:hypothetical protein
MGSDRTHAAHPTSNATDVAQALPSEREHVRSARLSRAWHVASSLPIALVVVLVIGLGLRVYAIAAYRPAVMTMSDSTAYVWDASGNLFGDAVRPAGYSLFLRGAHAVSSDLRFTIGLQHLFGLASAVLVYLAARRLGGSRLLSTFPAAVVALSGDQVFIEHTLLSESAFTLLLCGAIYSAIRMLDAGQPAVWGAISGVLIAAASTVRTAGLVLVPMFALWAALSLAGAWRKRLVIGATTLVAGVGVLMLYAGFQNRSEGTWSLARASGWSLYSRVAQFADCSEFTPPRGTRVLCETTPPDERPGPEHYGWVGGPARARFGAPPNGDAQLKEFAQTVVLHQPLDYAKVVLKDTVRYFVPTFGFDRPGSGTGPELFTFDRRAPGYEEGIEQAVEGYYNRFDLRLSPGGVRALASYQELIRVHGILFFQLIVLGIVGVFLTRGQTRRGLILLVGTTLVLLVIPAATNAYSARYGLPVEGLAAAAAALGGSALLMRLRADGQRPS